MHIAGKKLFLLHGDNPQSFNWNTYGLRIHAPKGTLASSETVELAAVALVGGHFKFPKNTIVVSGIYALSVSKPLLQPLRLEIQHCVDLDRPSQTKNLKFVKAPINLPCEFEIIEGGTFEVGNQYGSIEQYKFSYVGIVVVDYNVLPLVVVEVEQEQNQEQQPLQGESNEDEIQQQEIAIDEEPHENYPEEPREDYPREDYPEEPHEDYPEEPREDYPEEPREDYPEEPHKDYPEEPREDYPEEPHENYPEEPREDYPEEPHENYPEEPCEDYPEDIQPIEDQHQETDLHEQLLPEDSKEQNEDQSREETETG